MVKKCTDSSQECSIWNVPTEYDECRTYFEWAQLQPMVRDYLIKNVNEGKRSFYSGKRLKAIGLRRGLPDYHLPISNANWHGLWLEMKRIDGKTKTKDYDQVLWIKRLIAAKQYATFCYGAEEAIRITNDYLNNKI